MNPTKPEVEKAIEIIDQVINENLDRGSATSWSAKTSEPVKGDTVELVEKWEWVKRWLQQ